MCQFVVQKLKKLTVTYGLHRHDQRGAPATIAKKIHDVWIIFLLIIYVIVTRTQV